MAKLSVVIPVYNKEKYLKQCIESVLAQSYTDLEMICVDDGSTDSSLEIIREFAHNDKRIAILTQDNAGVSAARNKGVREASSPFITFIDPDDYLIDPFAYEKMINIAEHDGSDIVFSYFYDCDEHGNIEKSQFKNFCQDKAVSLQDKARFIRFAYPWQKLYKIDLFKKENILFPIGIVYEDNPVSLQLILKANQISIYPIHTIKYKPNKKSITRLKNLDAFNMFTAVTLMEQIIEENNIHDREFVTQYIDYRLELLAWGYFSLPRSIRHRIRYLKEWREILTDNDMRRLKECPDREFAFVYKYVYAGHSGMFLINQISRRLPDFLSYLLRLCYSVTQIRKIYRDFHY